MVLYSRIRIMGEHLGSQEKDEPVDGGDLGRGCQGLSLLS